MYRAAITGPATYGEDVMAARRTWSDLDESTRKLIIIVAVAEGILKVAALIDIKRASVYASDFFSHTRLALPASMVCSVES